MNMTVIHKSGNSSLISSDRILKSLFSDQMLANITFGGFSKSRLSANNGQTQFMVPRKWKTGFSSYPLNISYYDESIPVYTYGNKNRCEWFIIRNGRFIRDLDIRKFGGMLNKLDCDFIAVNADPKLQSYREKVRLTSEGNIAGFRRLYCDTILPEPVFDNWPDLLFMKNSVLAKILLNDTLPLSFTDLLDRCRDNSLKCGFFKTGRNVIDLKTEEGLLEYLAVLFNWLPCRKSFIQSNGFDISTKARIFGKIAVGNNVRIEKDAVIDGPAIIGDNVTICSAAVVRNSIIASNLTVPKDAVISNRVLIKQEIIQARSTENYSIAIPKTNHSSNNFRQWSWFSYAGFAKRLLDVIASTAVLILFAPIFPIIAIIIKLSSPGPVFFKHTRQGRHGREFSCLKFRTMITGANEIQEKLRSNNQVDGPQFKIEDDPRITMVGKFLRDTFIDEIPQFINILLGQMSLIGPRPSPKTENSMCPHWRNARLSVRPGITGLWQMRRTRQPGRDFQEWIYYDTKYVKKISLKMDLIIFWETIRKLGGNFLNQF